MYKIFFILVCNMGYLIIVEELLKVGVDVNFSDGNLILLIVIIKKGYLKIVEVLI